MKKPKNAKVFFRDSTFIKASGSRMLGGGGGGGVCVEVARKDNYVGIRDSKNPDGPVLCYTEEEWAVFIEGVKKGEFDA